MTDINPIFSYIDSSAFVKAYTKELEIGSDEVREIIFRAQYTNNKLISSVLLIGETVSAFDKWFRLNRINKNEFEKIVRQFILDLKELENNNGLILEDVKKTYVINSINNILSHHLSTNDSIHLFTAMNLGVSEFISSDKALNTAALEEGLRVVDVEL